MAYILWVQATEKWGYWRSEREKWSWEAWDGIGWQPFVAFTSFEEAWLFVWMWQVQKFVLCMLLAVKPHRTGLAPINMCLSCNYIVDEWVDSASECSITFVKQTRHRRWLYRSFPINVWREFVYTRVGCWIYLIWRLVFSANWQVYLTLRWLM